MIRKIINLISILFVVTLVTFFLLELSPIDSVRAYLGDEVLTTSVEQQTQIAERLGANQPAYLKYFTWLGLVLKGNLGQSMIYNKAVTAVIGARFSQSFILLLVSWVLSSIFGFILGIIAGINESKWPDRIIKNISIFLNTIPTFWLAILMILIFSVRLDWFPIGLSSSVGYLESDLSLSNQIYHAVLPTLTLSLFGVGDLALYTRSEVIKIMNSPYVTFAKTRGESKDKIIDRHVMKNTLIPILPIIFNAFRTLFSGSILVEQAFSYPGLGQLTVNAGLRGDFPLLLGIVLFTAIFVFIGNTIADLIQYSLDPKIRKEGGDSHD